MDLEFTFPFRGRNIEPELPSKPLGAGNFADAAMLIPLATDLHRVTFPGVEEVAIRSVMVFYGVHNARNVPQVAVKTSGRE